MAETGQMPASQVSAENVSGGNASGGNVSGGNVSGGNASAGNVSDLVLKAMVAVATADGRLDTREVAIIREIYEAREGRKLTAEAISRAQNARTKDATLAQIAAASPELDQDVKEEIIRVAYRVLLADKRVSGEERKTLNDIAMALEIPEIHFGAILEDLAVLLENKG